MGIKEIYDTVSMLPGWAKVISLAGVSISAFTLVLAPRARLADKEEARAFNSTTARIAKQIGPRSGCVPRIYPLLGFGTVVPSFWSVEDAAALLAGGDVNFVKRYEDSKAAVGVKFRFRSVQHNYVTDPVTEESNQLDVLTAISESAPEVKAFFAAGEQGRVFTYRQRTGTRVGDIRLYWLRVVPEVKLEVSAFVYVDSKDRLEFWKEVDEIIASLVLDKSTFAARAKVIASSQ